MGIVALILFSVAAAEGAFRSKIFFLLPSCITENMSTVQKFQCAEETYVVEIVYTFNVTFTELPCCCQALLVLTYSILIHHFTLF